MALPRNLVPRLAGLPKPLTGSQSARTPRRSRGDDGDGSESAICCAVRIRPLLSHEQSHRDGVRVSGQTVVISDDRGQERCFAADVVLDSRSYLAHGDLIRDNDLHATQAAVFESLGQPLVSRVLEGFNVCLIAYGHTGSGKTYTVLGEHWARERCSSGDCRTDSPRPADVNNQTMGLLPRALECVYASLSEELKTSDSQAASSRTACTVTFYEVYNEKVQDLLAPTSPSSAPIPVVESEDVARRKKRPQRPSVHFHPRFGAFVDGLAEVSCSRFEDALQLIAAGTQARTTAVTGLNDRSSRSHAVFTLRIERRSSSSNLIMVDLAGREQERLTQTSASCSERFKELTLINRSLFHLAHCVRTLAAEGPERAGLSVAGTGQGHHFRNSKLTMILGHALAGNSHTAFVGTLSPSRSAHEDSLATLRFCESVKQVRTRPVKDAGKGEDAVRYLEDEVRRLSTELNRAQTGRQLVEGQLTEAQNMCEYYRKSLSGLQKDARTVSPAASPRSAADSKPAPDVADRIATRGPGYSKGRTRRKQASSCLSKSPPRSDRSAKAEPGGIPGDASPRSARRTPQFVQGSEDYVRAAVTLFDGLEGQASPVSVLNVPSADLPSGVSTTASEGSTPRYTNISSSNTRNASYLSDEDVLESLSVDEDLRRAMSQWLEAAELNADDSPIQRHRMALIDTIQKLHSQLSGMPPGAGDAPSPFGFEMQSAPNAATVLGATRPPLVVSATCSPTLASRYIPATVPVNGCLSPRTTRGRLHEHRGSARPSANHRKSTWQQQALLDFKARVRRVEAGNAAEMTVKEVVSEVLWQKGVAPSGRFSVPCSPSGSYAPHPGTLHAASKTLLRPGGVSRGGSEEVCLEDSPRANHRSAGTAIALDDTAVASSSVAGGSPRLATNTCVETPRSSVGSPVAKPRRSTLGSPVTRQPVSRVPQSSLGSPLSGRRASMGSPRAGSPGVAQAKLCLSAQGLSTVEYDAEGRPTSSHGTGRARWNNAIRADSSSSSSAPQNGAVRADSKPRCSSPPSLRLDSNSGYSSPPSMRQTFPCAQAGPPAGQLFRCSVGSPPRGSSTGTSVPSRSSPPQSGEAPPGGPMRIISHSTPAGKGLFCRVPSAPVLTAALELAAKAAAPSSPSSLSPRKTFTGHVHPPSAPLVQGSGPCGQGLDAPSPHAEAPPWAYDVLPGHALTALSPGSPFNSPRNTCHHNSSEKGSPATVFRKISCEVPRPGSPSVELRRPSLGIAQSPKSASPTEAPGSPEVRVRLLRSERIMTPGRTHTTHEVLHWTMDLVSPSVEPVPRTS